MSQPLKVAGSLLLVMTLSLPLAAQNEGRRTGGETPAESTEKVLTAQQQRALGLLDQLFEAAKDFKEDEVKIRVQAQIADALWEHDEARARRHFEDAFRGVDSLTVNEQSNRNAPPIRFASKQFQLRSEILRMVGRRDAEFADKLIESVVDQPLNSNPSFVMPDNQNEQAMLYMQMAMSLIETDPQRAAQMARSSLNSGVNSMMAGFLRQLRRKNAALADEIFNQALTVAQRDQANFTGNITSLAPYVFPNYGGGMIVEIRTGPDRGPAEPEQPNPALIQPFLNTAYRAVMTQLDLAQARPTSVDGVRTDVRAMMDYRTVDGLLPFFDQYMPDKAAAIRGRMDEMTRQIPAERRDAMSSFNRQTSTQDLLSQAETAQTAQQKDSLYMRAALQASREGEGEQALGILDKISNEQTRTSLDSIIRLQAAMAALRKDDVETAYRYGKDLPNLQQRAMVFGQIAQMFLDKKDLIRARETLDDAEKLIGKAENGPEKARAMLQVAGVLARIDHMRGFEVMRTAVETINQTNFDAPPPGPLTAGNRAGGSVISVSFGPNTLNFDGSFPYLARADFDRALLLAQTLEKKEATVLAQLAVCRGILAPPHDSEVRPEEKDKEKDGNKDKVKQPAKPGAPTKKAPGDKKIETGQNREN